MLRVGGAVGRTRHSVSFLAEFVGAAGRAHALSLYAPAGRTPGLAGMASYDVALARITQVRITQV